MPLLESSRSSSFGKRVEVGAEVDKLLVAETVRAALLWGFDVDLGFDFLDVVLWAAMSATCPETVRGKGSERRERETKKQAAYQSPHLRHLDRQAQLAL